jgi:hypothetical protein
MSSSWDHVLRRLTSEEAQVRLQQPERGECSYCKPYARGQVASHVAMYSTRSGARTLYLCDEHAAQFQDRHMAAV